MLTRVISLQLMAFNRTRSSLCLFCSLSSPATATTSNLALVDCLTNIYKLTKIQALSISNRFSSVKSPDKPQLVHKLFLEYGFSETHIRSMILMSPQILFSNVDKTLRPKLEVLEQLGIEGYDLGKFISKNATVLTRSLEKKLIPCIEILKEILGGDESGRDFMQVLKCRWILWSDPQRLLANCTFLESCGIVGPHLALILKREPRIFLMKESELRELVSRVLDMGFLQGSKMFTHGFYIVSSLSEETTKEKLNLVRSFGFSEGECLEMFRRAPVLFRTSKEKLKFGIDFFLNTVEFKKSVLINSPWLLMSSMEKRVIPRYKVLQVLKLRRVFKKEPSFYNVLQCTEAEFLQNFVFRWSDDVDELLVAYMGHRSGSSEEEES
ncbi:Mitochodrial transcription termination factor [Parasponia andersonii]|uniref:Mitochodrial transcription termination factor n=1 Tax=Parasponia andersonii TaxID=3476 RepID=A0A2P5D3R5_PARAD|nr:Mitochodrial transcription termination factor [Parasponia andersonii]